MGGFHLKKRKRIDVFWFLHELKRISYTPNIYPLQILIFVSLFKMFFKKKLLIFKVDFHLIEI